MKEKTLEEIKKYDERRKKGWKIVWKKRKVKIKNKFFVYFFPPI